MVFWSNRLINKLAEWRLRTWDRWRYCTRSSGWIDLDTNLEFLIKSSENETAFWMLRTDFVAGKLVHAKGEIQLNASTVTRIMKKMFENCIR